MSDDPKRKDDKDPAPVKHSDAERPANTETPPDSAQKPEPSSDEESGAGTER
jgi:hypothetical protein